MTTYPTHEHPDLVSQAALDDLFADAQKWRDLTAELTSRGHDHLTSVEAIADHFPNFRAMADAIHAETDENTELALQCPPDAKLDAFLTPSDAKPIHKPHRPDSSLPEIAIQTIAKLKSMFGPVIIGYTDDDQLAFAFEDLQLVHTLPLHVLLSDLVQYMTTTQTLVPKTARSRQPKKPTKPTRLM
jgi:hypothetical protein